MSKDISIAGRPIGSEHPPFVVAEIGMNHNGKIALAEEMIEAAAESGADAVKFQTYNTKKYFSDDYSDFDRRQEYELDSDDHKRLKEVAASQDVVFLSTPFDRGSVDMLSEIDVPCFKIASFDVTNHHLLRHIAEQGKPIILSTGYSTYSEIAEAVEVTRETGNDQLVLLHCISEYPTPVGRMNLRAIKTLKNAFDVPVGLSDHTQGTTIAPVTATAMGASIIEKHFTLDNDLPGYDHAMSETPETFDRLTTEVKQTYEALGDGDLEPTAGEKDSLPSARRTLHWDGSHEKGEKITEEMILPLRPGGGLRVDELEYILGKKLAVDVDDRSEIYRSQINWDYER